MTDRPLVCFSKCVSDLRCKQDKLARDSQFFPGDPSFPAHSVKPAGIHQRLVGKQRFIKRMGNPQHGDLRAAIS
jgi:hypothetical protein